MTMFQITVVFHHQEAITIDALLRAKNTQSRRSTSLEEHWCLLIQDDISLRSTNIDIFYLNTR